MLSGVFQINTSLVELASKNVFRRKKVINVLKPQ